MRKFFLLGATILFASSLGTPALADGELGLGFLYHTHPIGVFYNAGGNTLHGGLAFEKNDVAEGSGALETEIGVAGAFLMNTWSGDSWGFGPAVGVAFTTQSPEGDGDSASQTHIGIGFYGHWDPTSMVSFWFGHGVSIDIDSPPVGDSTTDFGTYGGNIADFGFTVWLP